MLKNEILSDMLILFLNNVILKVEPCGQVKYFDIWNK